MTLKTCPFCGGHPDSPRKIGGDDERCGYNFEMRISCWCGASIAKQSHKDKNGWCIDKGEAKKEVINAWNSRT